MLMNLKFGLSGLQGYEQGTSSAGWLGMPSRRFVCSYYVPRPFSKPCCNSLTPQGLARLALGGRLKLCELEVEV